MLKLFFSLFNSRSTQYNKRSTQSAFIMLCWTGWFFLLVVAAKSICLSMLLFVLPLFWHFVVFKPIIFGYYQIYTSYSSQDILCSRVSQLSFAIFSLPTLTGLIFRKTVICPLHIPVSRRLNSFLPSFSEKKEIPNDLSTKCHSLVSFGKFIKQIYEENGLVIPRKILYFHKSAWFWFFREFQIPKQANYL